MATASASSSTAPRTHGPALRLVLATSALDRPFGRVLVGGGFFDLCHEKAAIPLAVFLGQWLLCEEDQTAEPRLRLGDDAGLGGRLYKAFSNGAWPKWAAPLADLREAGAWPLWRRDHGYLKPKANSLCPIDGACRAVSGRLTWRDDQRISGAELWTFLVDLVQGAEHGWSVADLDPGLRNRFEVLTGRASLPDTSTSQPAIGDAAQTHPHRSAATAR